MQNFSKIIFTFTTVILLTSQALTSTSNQIDSGIFSFEIPEYAKGLHVNLSGKSKTGFKWTAHDIQLKDIPYHVRAFHNPTIMAGFATGQTRSPQSTADRIANNWIPRFLKGSPHGGMTIFDTETEEPIGHIVAGGGDGPGVSEIAYTLMENSWDGKGKPSLWGKGIMSSVVASIIQEWAPEVRRLSENSIPESIRNAFTCFSGERLKRLDATASPSNPGSWYILRKHGFVPAQTNVKDTEVVADFDGRDLTPKAFEEELIKLYDVNTSANSVLEKNVRYQVIGVDGNVCTISHHHSYDRIKLHVELNLE